MSDTKKNIKRAYYVIAGIITAAAAVWAAIAMHADRIL